MQQRNESKGQAKVMQLVSIHSYTIIQDSSDEYCPKTEPGPTPTGLLAHVIYMVYRQLYYRPNDQDDMNKDKKPGVEEQKAGNPALNFAVLDLKSPNNRRNKPNTVRREGFIGGIRVRSSKEVSILVQSMSPTPTLQPLRSRNKNHRGSVPTKFVL